MRLHKVGRIVSEVESSTGLAPDKQHHFVLKILCCTLFFYLDSPGRRAYYAPQVEKSGRKWVHQSSL